MCDTREHIFLKDSILACKEKSEENFKAACTQYNKFATFDKWKINVFTLIRQKLSVSKGFEGNDYLNGDPDYT